MATKYTNRVAFFVPESLRADANQLALALGESAEDDKTFREPTHVAKDGSDVALQETMVTDTFMGKANGIDPLEAPAHAPNADLAAAARARAAVTFTPPARAGAIFVAIDTPMDEAIAVAQVAEKDLLL